MAYPRKVKRNKEMVQKWWMGESIASLARFYNINYRAAWEIINRDQVLYKPKVAMRVVDKSV